MSQNIRIVQSEPGNVVRVIEGRTSFPISIKKPKEVVSFTIFQQGPPGRTGDTGAAGDIAPPFYLVDGTTDYATTSSIAFNGLISSSLVPSGSENGMPFHSLGSLTNPWKDLYVATSSIKFIQSGEIISELKGLPDTIYIGDTYFTTQSIGFVDDPVIIKNTSDVSIKVTGSIENEITDRDGLVIRSGSAEVLKVDQSGRVILYNFQTDPGAVNSSLFFSGSSFYVGI